ncbi:MAG: hypothetical protein AB4372_16470, partial [Xenococcus sp. (in: cyanobacteria)]
TVDVPMSRLAQRPVTGEPRRASTADEVPLMKVGVGIMDQSLKVLRFHLDRSLSIQGVQLL